MTERDYFAIAVALARDEAAATLVPEHIRRFRAECEAEYDAWRDDGSRGLSREERNAGDAMMSRRLR